MAAKPCQNFVGSATCGAHKAHPVHGRHHPQYHAYLAATPEPVKRHGLAARSEKMDEFYKHERIPLVELVIARDGGRCQIVSPWHERVADWNPITVHEIRSRGREGGIMAEGVNDPDNCVAACLRCNQAMQENPEWAEAHGWLKPASEVAP